MRAETRERRTVLSKFQDCEDLEGAVLLGCVESLNEIEPLAMQRVIRYLAERCLIRLQAEHSEIDKSIAWVKTEITKQDHARLTERRVAAPEQQQR
jgi:hypothetical protein